MCWHRGKEGKFLDNEYRERWIRKYGGVLDNAPTEEQWMALEVKFDNSRFALPSELVAPNLYLAREKLEKRSNEGYAFDEPTIVTPLTRYRLMYIVGGGSGDYGGYDITHDLICNNREQVVYALIKVVK